MGPIWSRQDPGGPHVGPMNFAIWDDWGLLKILIWLFSFSGKGHFGDVFLAKAHGIKDGEPETLVVVKSLLSRDEQHQFQFRREIDMFCKVHHENVARLLGVCREMEPQFSIAEYCEWVSAGGGDRIKTLRLLGLSMPFKITGQDQPIHYLYQWSLTVSLMLRGLFWKWCWTLSVNH